MSRIKAIAAKPANEWTADESNYVGRYSLAGLDYYMRNFAALCEAAKKDYQDYNMRGWSLREFTMNPFDTKAADIWLASEEWPLHPWLLSDAVVMINMGNSNMDPALQRELLDALESYGRYNDVLNAIANMGFPDGYSLLLVFDEYYNKRH